MSRYPPIPPAAGSIYPLKGKPPIRDKRTDGVETQPKEVDAMDSSTQTSQPQDVRSYIRSLAATAKETRQPVEIDIGPDLAFEKYFLEINPENNRRIYPAHIAEMMRFRRSGKDFYTRSHPMVINWNGEAENGQHRATVAVRSGLPSRHRVVIGVMPGSEYNTDYSKRLTVIDATHKDGFPNADKRATAVNLILSIESNTIKCWPDDIRTKKVKELNGNSVWESSVLFGLGAPDILHASAGIVACYLLVSKFGKEAQVFLDEIRNGTNVRGRMRAIRAIKMRLEKLKSLSKSDKEFRGMKGNIHCISAIVLAWKSYPAEAPSLAWDSETHLIPELVRPQRKG